MAPAALLLALSIGLAALLGFAAAHGGICAVRAVDDLLEGRGGALFLGFLKCSAWVAALTLPLVWTMVPGSRLAFGQPPDWPAAVGGFVFGIGAAVNGGCAFSTISHLGAGDLGAGLALVGLGLGFALHDLRIDPLVPTPVAPGPSVLAQPEAWSLAMLALLWAWAAWEAVRLLRREPQARVDRAVAVIGLGGGALYAMHGPWVYTVGLAQGAGWAVGAGPRPWALIPLLFLAVLAGAILAAHARGRFRLRRPTRSATVRGLAGGTLMGIGAALVPGGNDALVLHALPGLAPHAAMAYAALVAGAGCTLLADRAIRRVRGHT